MSAGRLVPCQFCGERFDPAGIRNHEQWCDDNPEPGVPPDRQGGRQDTSGGDDRPGGLPPVSTIEAPESDQRSSRESGSQVPQRCQSCQSTSVRSGSEALAEYRGDVDQPRPDVQLAFLEASWYCPDCYVVGGVVDEPTELDELLEVS